MKSSVRNLLWVVVIAVVIILLALPKLGPIFSDKEEGESTQAAAAAPSALPVEVTVVQPEAYRSTLQLTGSVQANEMLELRSEVAGIVERIYFNEGQQVQQGELLFTIRNQDLQAQLRKAEAQQQLYQDSETRYRQLLEREAVSREEFEQATNNLKTAESDISLLKAQLAKTRVYAPFSGTIGLRRVSPGTYVSAGTSVASMYDLTPAKLEFAVPGKYAGQVKVGTAVEFTTDGSTATYQGEIYAIEPQVDPATRTLTMRARSPNPNQDLLPGQFARITLPLSKSDESLMVASQAVVPEMNGHKVYVLEKGLVAEKQIEIGARTANQVQVLAGLTPGDTVLTTGILQVRPGSTVQVTQVN
jgi:membrane fusion protein (multidrug efflux system)